MATYIWQPLFKGGENGLKLYLKKKLYIFEYPGAKLLNRKT